MKRFAILAVLLFALLLAGCGNDSNTTVVLQPPVWDNDLPCNHYVDYQTQHCGDCHESKDKGDHNEDGHEDNGRGSDK